MESKHLLLAKSGHLRAQKGTALMSHAGVLRSRLAPTPSGWIHVGNAYSFVLTALIVRSQNGELFLRIDDLDVERSRPEYIEDIFEQLRWLGLEWDGGPTSVLDLKTTFSQNLKTQRYQLFLEDLKSKSQVFACDCSRALILRRSGSHFYDGFCKNRGLVVDDEKLILRFRFAPKDQHQIQDIFRGQVETVDPELTDFIVVRRSGDFSYQLISVVDDLDSKVNFVVRGDDLLPSTIAQTALANAAGASEFASIRFLHHGHIVDNSGAKLSKSKESVSLRHLRSLGLTRQDFYRVIARHFGLENAHLIENFQNLLEEAGERGLEIAMQERPWT